MPQKGKHHSPETIEKIRTSNLGKKRSAQAVENNRLSKIGKPSSRKGAHHTEEAKQKLREARARQIHPAFVANGIDPEMVTQATIRGMRWCSGCKAFLFKVHFYRVSRYCMECCRSAQVRVREKRTPEDREQWAQSLREWRATNPGYEKKWRLFNNYGVSPEWYANKLQEQEGACEICRVTIEETGKLYFCVDHNHSTGAVRGLLCHGCNILVGRIENRHYRTALDYLARYATA